MLDSIPPLADTAPLRIVFLHGSGCGPWIWEEVRNRLEWDSVALSVPSNRPGTNPERCAAELLEDPTFPANGPVVLVLHSLAGVLEAPLVKALGNRVLLVVHIATVAPPPGRTYASTAGFPANLVLPLLFWLNPRGLMPSPAMLVRQLGEDLSPAQRTEMVARHRPEQRGLFLEPVPSVQVRVPRAYLLCANDRCVSPSLQARIAKRLGAHIHSIEAGHLPMLARPVEFVEILSRSIATARSTSEQRMPATSVT